MNIKTFLRITFLSAVLFSILTVKELQAQTKKISVQGILKNADGTAVSDGNYNVTFNLYNVATGGSVLDTETQASLQVNGGIYNTILQSGIDGLSFTENYYLGIQIDGGIELTPRVELTATPYALNILGEINVPGGTHFKLGTGANTTSIRENDNGNMYFYTGNDLVNSKMSIATSGEVTIGGGKHFKFGTAANNISAIREWNGGEMHFYTANDLTTEKMALDINGNLIVKKDLYADNLFADGDKLIVREYPGGGAGDWEFYVKDGLGDLAISRSGSADMVTFEASGDVRTDKTLYAANLTATGSEDWEFYVDGSKNLLVNPKSSANYSYLDFGGTGWSHASDSRLKTNISSMTGQLEKVISINPVYYNWKHDKTSPQTIGVIAQELEKIYPELVSEIESDGKKMKGVSYNMLSVVAIQAIKELSEEVNQLKAEKAILVKEKEQTSASLEDIQQRLIKLEQQLNLNDLQGYSPTK